MIAAQEANLAQVEISNKQPNLWRSELYSQVLTAGTASYVLPARMIAIISAYISTTSSGLTTDRVIGAISAEDYSGLATKAQQAPPSAYWYNRQSTPVVTLWPVPDTATTYTLNIRIISQQQDVSIPSGTNLDIPYRGLDAFTAGFAARLAVHFAPDRMQLLKALAAEAWTLFAEEDQERVPLSLSPMLEGYYR